MITIDMVKKALCTDTPYSRLDEIVRMELQNGRQIHEVTKDLKVIVVSIQDKIDEPLAETVDQLLGNFPIE